MSSPAAGGEERIHRDEKLEPPRGPGQGRTPGEVTSALEATSTSARTG